MGLDDRMDTVHRRWAEPARLAVLASAVALQRGVEVVNVQGGQLVERDLAERWDNPFLHVPLILAVGAALLGMRAGIGIQPIEQIVPVCAVARLDEPPRVELVEQLVQARLGLLPGADDGLEVARRLAIGALAQPDLDPPTVLAALLDRAASFGHAISPPAPFANAAH